MADLLLEGGSIIAVERPGILPLAQTEIDAGGRLATPGLADPHLHPDKAFGLDDAASSAATLPEAIAAVRALKPSVNASSICERTVRLLRWCLSLGTTRARVHAEVDPHLQLRSVEGVLAAREMLRDCMHVEVVAFPQEGIVREPGTLELMREAMVMGCDVVGAISYSDVDALEHLSLAADLANRFGAPLDVHADFGIAPESSALPALCDVTHRFGLEGRVAAGHCTTLATMGAAERALVTERLSGAGVTVISLPRTDLFLDGVVAPLDELRRAGIRCHVGTNNVRNAFTPVGRPSLPSVAAVYALAAHSGAKRELELLARSLWHSEIVTGTNDLVAGATADLCIWPVHEPWRLVADESEPNLVFVGGYEVASRCPSEPR
jgi:cytosine deaminase